MQFSARLHIKFTTLGTGERGFLKEEGRKLHGKEALVKIQQNDIRNIVYYARWKNYEKVLTKHGNNGIIFSSHENDGWSKSWKTVFNYL